MTDTSAAGPITILLTADDPTHCAEALMHLYGSQVPDGTDLVVICHGENAKAVAELVHSAGEYPGTGKGAVTVTDLTRMQAINTVIAAMSSEDEQRHALILDQAVRVAPGWLQGLLACLEPKVIHGLGNRTIVPDSLVAMVGPCMDQTNSEAQRIILQEHEVAMGLTAYTAARLNSFKPGMVSSADVLDGSCLLVSAKTIRATTRSGDLLNVPCGEWAWADLALRADGECAVSEQVFVGRADAVAMGSQTPGDAIERLDFYARHPVKTVHNVVAVIPVRIGQWQDLQLLRAAISRSVQIVDGLALVLCTNPLNAFADPTRPKRLAAIDEKLMKACDGADARRIAAAFTSWAFSVANKSPGNGVVLDMVWCEVFEGKDEIERHARNHGLQMAESMSADAVLMLDGDEMIEYAFTRAQLQRTLQHPNPMVRCFDIGILYAWDAPSLVREDSPWGHSGTYQGGAHGPRLYRRAHGQSMQIRPGERAGAVRSHGIAAHRVASLRLRRFRFSRPVDREKITDGGEGMRLSQWQMDNRIGMHMLVWRNENPEDVARWFDTVHAVVDHAVLVWTDEWLEADKGWTLDADLLDGDTWPATGPSRSIAMVAHLHGAEWVHEPLADDIAGARNAGITTLRDRGGLAWAWFMDPDEWLGDRMADCVTLRNMACSSRWGWLMQVANYRADKGTPTISDSVRISRLDGDVDMLMNGRVHESFSNAIKDLQASGIHPRLVYAPFVVQHRGMAFDAETMSNKLDKYDRLLRLQLDDEQNDPGSWVSLGWQYFNDGHDEQGLECYEHALACAGTSYLPYKEMAYVHLRKARELMGECNARLDDAHQFSDLAKHMSKWLDQYAPQHQVIERPDGWDGGEPAPLPEWIEPE